MRGVRVALVWLLTFLMAMPSWAAMALVQSNCATGNLFAGTSTYVYTYPSAPTVGNLVVIGETMQTRTISSIAGTATTYTINGSNTNNATAGYNTSLWKAIFAGSDTTATLTASGNSGGTDTTVCFWEFSGASSDQSGSVANGAANNLTTTHNSGSVTPPTADNVVVSMIFISGTVWTADSGFTNTATGQTIAKAGYIIQSSATAQEYNGTTDSNRYSAMRIGAFAGASSSMTVGGLGLLGVGR